MFPSNTTRPVADAPRPTAITTDSAPLPVTVILAEPYRSFSGPGCSAGPRGYTRASSMYSPGVSDILNEPSGLMGALLSKPDMPSLLADRAMTLPLNCCCCDSTPITTPLTIDGTPSASVISIPDTVSPRLRTMGRASAGEGVPG